MSAVVAAPRAVRRPVRTVALLGTGLVGSAFLDRWERLRGHGVVPSLRLVHVANSRTAVSAVAGVDPRTVGRELAVGGRSRLTAVAAALAADGGLVVDATASEEVAGWHPRWLAAGIAVVTANKAGIGGECERYDQIQQYADRYGDSATVGAGLPVLSSLRQLRAGGDRIHALAGVVSGSMAWLLDSYDGRRPFAELVRLARERGFTEPDPRADLAGQDAVRKLLILARTAGHRLTPAAVQVDSLVPRALADTALADLDQGLSMLDGPMRERYAHAWAAGRRLRYVARLAADGRATVGVEALGPDDPLGGGGCDNRLSVWSDRYPSSPLVVQGPGAGAEVTAAALIDDVLRLV